MTLREAMLVALLAGIAMKLRWFGPNPGGCASSSAHIFSSRARK